MKIEQYINKSAVYSIIENGRNLERIIDLKVTESRLSYYQVLILISLYVEPERETFLRDLAQIFPLSKGAISQSLSLLESLGLIKRKPTSDKRKNRLMVTKKGEVEALKLQAILETIEQSFDSNIDFYEVEKVRNYLKSLDV